MRVRKRVITLGLCLGLCVSQLMIHANNKAIANNIGYQLYSTDASDLNDQYYYPPQPENKKNKTQNITTNTIEDNKELKKNNSTKINNTNSINTDFIKPQQQQQQQQQQQHCAYTLGINIIKEPYNKKILITEVIRNSPAHKAGLQVGDEIIRLNGDRVKNLTLQAFINKVNKSGRTISLYIRDTSNEKYDVNVGKANVCFPIKESDELFNSYWLQIGPDVEPIPEILMQRISIQAKNYDIPVINNWLKRKTRFRYAYNSCRNSTITSKDMQECMSNIITQHLAEISQESKQQHQMNMVRVGVQAISGLSYALMNQHVNHSGTVNVNQNVHYSGGYNVNHKIDHNIKHNVYWHNW